MKTILTILAIGCGISLFIYLKVKHKKHDRDLMTDKKPVRDGKKLMKGVKEAADKGVKRAEMGKAAIEAMA